MSAHAGKRTGFLALAVVSLQLVAVAHGAPVPNLVLTCSDENAIGQEQNACDGIWAYQIPANALVVSSGSFGVWVSARDLASSDTVLVCTLPVEPGQYSSCRDASGARRTAFVRKDSITGHGTVTVSKTGGDYTDPVTAAQNAFAGDTWCVAPQWPEQPCVMAIGEGVFILHEKLSIPEQIVVAGAGKGATLLVADNGVEAAVNVNGPGRISDVMIVNGQIGGARTIGVQATCANCPLALIELHDVAVHVGGAAHNTAVAKYGAGVEILDSVITAAGQDTIGITTVEPHQDGAGMSLERTHVAAEVALDQPGKGDMRLIDSRVFGTLSFNGIGSRLEIVRSSIVGNVTATNERVRVIITDSSIQGDVNANARLTGLDDILITNTNVEGNFAAGFMNAESTFDGLSVQGEFVLENAWANVLRSYIYSASTAAALSIRGDRSRVRLEKTFVQGVQALVVEDGSQLEAFSSVLAGPVSADVGAVLNCTGTYGADYELSSPSCQPQPP